MENSLSSNKLVIKWSLYYVVVSIILTYAFQLLNIDPNSGIKFVTFLPYVGFMFLCQKEYRDQLSGYLTFGQGFLAGFKYTVITAILGTLFIYIYWTVLSPQMFQQIVDTSRAKLEAKGNLTEDQINMAMSFTTIGFMTISAFIGSLIMGTIIALIGAAIFKKQPPMFASVSDSEVVE